MGMCQRPASYQPEKTRQPQMRDNDHHAKKKRQYIEIDGPIGFFRRDRSDRHHQRRAGKRNAGPIQPEPGNAA